MPSPTAERLVPLAAGPADPGRGRAHGLRGHDLARALCTGGDARGGDRDAHRRAAGGGRGPQGDPALRRSGTTPVAAPTERRPPPSGAARERDRASEGRVDRPRPGELTVQPAGGLRRRASGRAGETRRSLPEIVITEFMDEAAVAGLAADFDVRLRRGPGRSAGRAGAGSSRRRALIVRNRTQVRGELLAAARALEVIGRLGVGLDNIDVDACRARGIAVCPATGANDVSVAEYVIAAS